MEVRSLLQTMVQHKASDLFLTAGAPPSIKMQGKNIPLSNAACSADETLAMILSLMTEQQKNEYERTHECNFAFESPNVGRFRISAFMQRGQAGCVMRNIQTHVPQLEDLHLPNVVKNLSMLQKGLVLIVGGPGMGKTTTLAAMLGYRNLMAKGHILTIEDPIEYLHEHKQCIVTQREVGVDTSSYEIALKNAMRQAPDVIQIGEIRDANTMRYAITYAETGHLCLATLHANSTYQALERIVHFYPENIRDQLWMDLSMNLRAIVAQQLLPSLHGKGYAVATEILINTPLIAEKIRKGEVHLLKDYMTRKNSQGMHTFDQSLFELCASNQISYQEALARAESVNNFRLMMKLGNLTPEVRNQRGTDRNWTIS